MKKFLSEFKEFIMRGNVLDMAVGVIVATAFGKITTSLVNDLFMPFISWLFGTRDMSALNLIVRPEIVENGAVVQEAITIGFGSFVAVVIDFLLMSLVVFIILKLFNKARAMTEKKVEEPEPEEEPAPTTEQLLAEILEELKKSSEAHSSEAL